MAKSYKIESANIYYAIIAASCFYSTYQISQNFGLRILSSIAIITFYILSILYITERRELFQRQYLNNENRHLFQYIGIVLLILTLSIKSNLPDIITLLFHPLAFLAYIIAVVSITVDNYTLSVLKQISNKVTLLIPLVILIDINIFDELVLTNELCYFVLFEFLFLDKLTWKKRIYLTTVMISIILLENSYDNRTLAFKLLTVSLGILIFLTIDISGSKVLKYVILFLGLFGLYLVVFNFENTFTYISSFISNSNVNTTDTRSFLFIEFFKDFHGKDMFIGKGYLGTYFSEWFLVWDGGKGDSFDRFSIEVGVLQILLKGGFLLLGPFLLIVVRALRIGFLNKTMRTVEFRLSIFLLIQLILMGIENIPSFGLNYMFIWLSVGIIFRKFQKKNKVQKNIEANQRNTGNYHVRPI